AAFLTEQQKSGNLFFFWQRMRLRRGFSATPEAFGDHANGRCEQNTRATHSLITDHLGSTRETFCFSYSQIKLHGRRWRALQCVVTRHETQRCDRTKLRSSADWDYCTVIADEAERPWSSRAINSYCPADAF